jgi:hypothetical protein
MWNSFNSTGHGGQANEMEGCLAQVDAGKSWFTRRVLPLSLDQLRWRPESGHWSIGECLDHLNLTLALYLPKIEDTIGMACRESRISLASVRQLRNEAGFLSLVEPPVQVCFLSPQALLPSPVIDRDRLADRFHRLRNRYADAVRRAALTD